MKLSNAILDKVSTMKDGSMKLVFLTRSLSPQEMAEIMLGVNQEIVEVELPDDMAQPKSQSERLRNVTYRLWEQSYKDKYKDFNIFYDSYMNKLIEGIKEKLS